MSLIVGNDVNKKKIVDFYSFMNGKQKKFNYVFIYEFIRVNCVLCENYVKRVLSEFYGKF